MSADKWTQCPRCYVTNRSRANELDREASESYGNVSVEKFDELRRHAEYFRKSLTTDDNICFTLREDYEIGIRDGEFSVYYGASCQTCGFKFEFKHEEKVQ
jgi:predicted Zn-ribbon and HTH transcriptional regulator